MGLRQKQQLYTLIAELHAAGVTAKVVLAEVLGISEAYVRRIVVDLGLRPPRVRTVSEALAILDPDLRRRVMARRKAHGCSPDPARQQ